MSEPSEKELALRHSLGQFATGVTVITCCAADGRPCGITANSFSSVSLDPPLILWNIAKVSNSLEAYLCAPYFGVHVLKASQQHLAEYFARTDHTVYDGIEYELSEHNVPVLPDVLARFDCATRDVHEAGDHHIIIGDVLAFESVEAEPLLFFNSSYRVLPDPA